MICRRHCDSVVLLSVQLPIIAVINVARISNCRPRRLRHNLVKKEMIFKDFKQPKTLKNIFPGMEPGPAVATPIERLCNTEERFLVILVWHQIGTICCLQAVYNTAYLQIHI